MNYKIIFLSISTLLAANSVTGMDTTHQINQLCNQINKRNDLLNATGPLFTALADQNFDTIKDLINENVNVNTTDKYGLSFLYKLVRELSNENIHQISSILDCLQKTDININYQNNSSKNTALHGAAAHEKCTPTIINQLLCMNAHIDAQNTKKMTPLHLAIQYNNITIAQFLIESGANVTIKDKKGRTALHYAAQLENDNIELVKLLLFAGANYNAIDKKGKSPYDYAIILTEQETISEEEEEEEISSDGVTASIIASILESPESVQKTIEYMRIHCIKQATKSKNPIKALMNRQLMGKM